MDYEELKIRLERVSDKKGEVEARVMASPTGEQPSNHFTLPFTRDDLEQLDELAKRRVRVAEGMEESVGAVPKTLRSKAVGRALFGALFGGELEGVYRRALERVHPGEDRGLRLRLVFPLGQVLQGDELSRLPWELLYDGARERYLARQRGLALVRTLEWKEKSSSRPVTVRCPLRLLVMDPAPRELRQLDLKTERAGLLEALAPLFRQGALELYEADTLPRMRQVLLDRRIHVLHFMGHGGYLERQGLGALQLETGEGCGDEVDGDDLGEHVDGAPELRLVVLNACYGARYAGDAGRPARYGVAAGLLQRTDLPAVLAMQHQISDPGAAALTAAFYRRLVAGDEVDTALGEARLGLSRESGEWTTPVLFLQAPDGKLFEIDSRSGGAASPRDLPPRQLGVRSVDRPSERDYGSYIPEVTDVTLDLRGLFRGRYIEKDEWWVERMFPELGEFLDLHTRGMQPVELHMAAHQTVAFTCGWILQVKRGLKVAVHQPTRGEGTRLWYPEDGSDARLEGDLWEELEVVELEGGGPDVAVVLSTSRSIGKAVTSYIRRESLPVGRLLVAEVAGGGRDDAVAGGGHANLLARSLARRIEKLSRSRGSCLHLFSSAPLGLLVFLGQLAQPFGRIRLYEHAFEATDSWDRYHPSLELPITVENVEPPPDW